eukprot:Amastigsp_a519041_3.p2 type:complete len:105 gc:universal Amastigsp_a519041_3:336-22(-)
MGWRAERRRSEFGIDDWAAVTLDDARPERGHVDGLPFLEALDKGDHSRKRARVYERAPQIASFKQLCLLRRRLCGPSRINARPRWARRLRAWRRLRARRLRAGG